MKTFELAPAGAGALSGTYAEPTFTKAPKGGVRTVGKILKRDLLGDTTMLSWKRGCGKKPSQPST